MAAIASDRDGSLEQLELARQKAKGLLGTIRDLAVIRTQVLTFRDTGLLHPIRTLRPTDDFHISSSSAVGEHVTTETEEGKVIKLLNQAYDAFSSAEFDKGKNILKQTAFISTCSRCVRNISGIGKLIEEGDLYEARRRLNALITLIPSYYSVIEGEAELQGEEAEEKGGKGSEKAEEELEEACGGCAASEILEICGWDVHCINHVIELIESTKKAGGKVYNDELIQKAREYAGRGE